MQIGVTTQCMNDGEENSRDEKIPTMKSDAYCCFLIASSFYWRSDLVGQIQTG